MEGQKAVGGWREARNAKSRQTAKRCNPSSSLAEVPRNVEEKRQKRSSRSLVSKVLLEVGLKSYLMGRVSELSEAMLLQGWNLPRSSWMNLSSSGECFVRGWKTIVLHKSKKNRSWQRYLAACRGGVIVDTTIFQMTMPSLTPLIRLNTGRMLTFLATSRLASVSRMILYTLHPKWTTFGPLRSAGGSSVLEFTEIRFRKLLRSLGRRSRWHGLNLITDSSSFMKFRIAW